MKELNMCMTYISLPVEQKLLIVNLCFYLYVVYMFVYLHAKLYTYLCVCLFATVSRFAYFIQK